MRRSAKRKLGGRVKFELTDLTRQAVDDYLRVAGKKLGEFLFTAHRASGQYMTTRQYARLVSKWIANIGLDPRIYGTHSLRRTKATLIYRRTDFRNASKADAGSSIDTSTPHCQLFGNSKLFSFECLGP